VRLRLVPRTEEFYALLASAGANAHEAARAAEIRFREFPNASVGQDDIKELEHRGDRIITELVHLLDTAFIAPFDREDIFGLASAVDDVVDNIDNATEMLGLYAIESPTRQALDLCAVLVGACAQLETATASLRRLRGAEAALVEVKRLEDEGDRIVRAAVADLFRDDRIDPLIVIRWKDVYEALEGAIDACDQAATVLGNIIVKNQ
jgi:uncharacterized protein Yka (UPF0111/DUF47 family)